MEYLIEAFVKIAVEEAVRIAVDHPVVFSVIGAAARRIAVLFWL